MDHENEALEVEAGEVAEEVAEAIAEPIAEVIENAAEAQVEAEETAEAIAAAAMESARGQRIETVEREVAACQINLAELRGTLESLPNSIALETMALMEPMNSRLSAVEAALGSLTLAGQSQLTPPALEAEPVPVEVVEPMETPPAPAAEEENPAPRPKRFLSL